jgi:hypothetical protein
MSDLFAHPPLRMAMAEVLEDGTYRHGIGDVIRLQPGDHVAVVPQLEMLDRWPLPIWRVTDLLRPIENAPFWFCAGYTISEVIPAWRSFGDTGLHIESVIRLVQSVDMARVTRLPQAVTPKAGGWGWSNYREIERCIPRVRPPDLTRARYCNAFGAILAAVAFRALGERPTAVRYDELTGKPWLGEAPYATLADAATRYAAAIIGAQRLGASEASLLAQRWLIIVEAR